MDKYCWRILDTIKTYEGDVNSFADNLLKAQTYINMQESLALAARTGKYGWWDESVCTVAQLRQYREKALRKDDHISVINYTAMIAART